MIVNTTLQYNQAVTTTGGAISNQAGALTLLNSTLQHNQAASNGGGFYAGSINSQGTVISNTTLYSNTALGKGGGFYLNQTAVMTNTTLSENASGGGVGRAIWRAMPRHHLWRPDLEQHCDRRKVAAFMSPMALSSPAPSAPSAATALHWAGGCTLSAGMPRCYWTRPRFIATAQLLAQVGASSIEMPTRPCAIQQS
ncbi:MAG: hypothetical protein R2856_27845 [Caldilineaceae bacterium]